MKFLLLFVHLLINCVILISIKLTYIVSVLFNTLCSLLLQFSLYPRNKILFTSLSTVHALHFILWSLNIGESFRTSLSGPNSNLREREGVITICLIHSKIFPEIVDSPLTKIWKTMCGWSKYENVVNAWLRNRGRGRPIKNILFRKHNEACAWITSLLIDQIEKQGNYNMLENNLNVNLYCSASINYINIYILNLIIDSFSYNIFIFSTNTATFFPRSNI